ncbi:hypothetical protein PAXRUDRAFT_500919 [Paxillus rubicundulus Ve08.2h10]|uniref:Unplaced genomic scaffold scaffold_344, whole genome shotgun sequence n=1 Tax=Paxillus rubicundulus Ve08.2h10 TaxID=930991 RepID=A0A0D0D9F4_9AGAM|nr:hypothetical protein PAXRUDRAFT_500919 [Paxillus rubicundulus Ve08.2h10]
MTHEHSRNSDTHWHRTRNGTETGGKPKKSEQAFESRINTAFTVTREASEKTSRDTNSYADAVQKSLSRLEELHARKRAASQIMKAQARINEFENLFSTYPSLLDDLVPCRMQVIQAGQEMTQAQSAQMRKSRKNMMNAAKRGLDEGREEQRLVADASELIKHYKALILAI